MIYVTNLDEYKSIGTHWIVFSVNIGDSSTIYVTSHLMEHTLTALQLNAFQKNPEDSHGAKLLN